MKATSDIRKNISPTFLLLDLKYILVSKF